MFYRFCMVRKDDPIIDNLDTGTVNLDGTLDLQKKIASVSFTRPFEVSSDDAMTLVGGQTYKIWLTWGIFRADDDYA